MKRKILVVALLVAVVAAASIVTSSRDDFNVILITIDTLRADYLSCYNQNAAPTPNIDRIAAQSAVFRTAYTVIPITLPAHTALLTSKQPHNALVFNNGDQYTLKFPTLADLLSKRGYRTAAFVSLGVLRRKFGLASGFETYDDDFSASNGRHYRFASEVNGRALPWIDKNKRSRFFAWLHYSDPHEPYFPADAGADTEVTMEGRVLQQFTLGHRERIKINAVLKPGINRLQFRAIEQASDPLNRTVSGVRLKSSEAIDASYEGWSEETFRSGETVRFFQEDQTPALILNNHGPSRADVEISFIGSAAHRKIQGIWKNYAEEVQYVDRFIGQLWQRLEKQRLLDRTIVVLTADHGEGLKSHGFLGHVDNLYEETLRIPLMIYVPGKTGQSFDAPANLLDVLPTVLDLVDEEKPEALDGNSLKHWIVPSWFQKEEDSNHWKFACTLRPEAPQNMYAAMNGKIKLIHTPSRKGRPWEYYDLPNDPRERKNLASSEQADQHRLVKYRAEVEAAHGKRKNPVLEEEEREMLEALGYTGSN